MSDITDRLCESYESEGYAVDSVTDNRGRLRVVLRADGSEAETLRRIARDVCGEESVLGLNVTAESTPRDDAVTTVVSFRYRD